MRKALLLLAPLTLASNLHEAASRTAADPPVPTRTFEVKNDRPFLGGKEINQDALVFLVDAKVTEEQLVHDSIIPKWVSFARGDVVFPTDVRPAPRGW